MEMNAANVLSSPSVELANGDFGSRLSFKESMSCGSKPRLQLKELTENIESAEINYNSAKRQWDYYKSLHHSEVTYGRNGSVTPPKSISSLNSFKSTTSEHSVPREELAQLGSCQDVLYSKRGAPGPVNDGQGDRVHVVMTPRTPKDGELAAGVIEGAPPGQLAVRTSLNSVRTNKRSKRVAKLKKKSQLSRMQSETMKPAAPSPVALKPRRRKFHGRVKITNSKSTVGTRDTNFSDKKADRRKFRKQKSLETISVFQAPQFRRKGNPLKGRESKQLNDNVTELYHNNKTLKSGSLSVVPSRPTKLEHTHYCHLHAHQADQPAQSTDAPDDREQASIVDDKASISVTEIGENSFIEAEPPTVEQKSEIEIKTETQEQSYFNHMHNCSHEYYDAFQQRNYEMPTMSSKMKRVHRPYYQRFNVRNIPFVVGTSISPSHNLGLNIQQVLSIIKSRQPTVPGISPLLIRKVSKGIRPVSTLFEEINNEVTKSCRNINFQHSPSQKSHMYNQGGGTLSCEQFRSSNINSSISSSTANQAPYKQSLTCEPLYEEDEDTHSSSSDSKTALQKKNSYQCQMRSEVSIKNHQHHVCHRHSRKHIAQAAETGVGDYTTDAYNYPSNNQEMTDVFKRFYDQYEKMTSQLEKMKEQSEKRKEKTVTKEISELEAAISAKEKEITAVVNLYKEVMSLKHQMRLLHERNSFVCIATQDPAFRQTRLRARARTAGPFEVKYQRSEIHGTPNALRLAGLLRQIQAFQRQLSLV